MILQTAQDPNTKFFALQILDEAVNVRKHDLRNLYMFRLVGKFFLMIKRMGSETS